MKFCLSFQFFFQTLLYLDFFTKLKKSEASEHVQIVDSMPPVTFSLGSYKGKTILQILVS